MCITVGAECLAHVNAHVRVSRAASAGYCRPRTMLLLQLIGKSALAVTQIRVREVGVV